MNILHIVAEKGWRGGEQQAAYLVEGLRAQGHNVVVACRKGQPVAQWCAAQGVPHHTFGFANALDVATARGLARLIGQQKPQLLHAHSSKAHSMALLARRFGAHVPVVVSRRVPFAIKPSSHGKYNHQAISRVICISEAVRQAVLPALKQPQKAVVVHSGIEAERFNPAAHQATLAQTLGLHAETPLVGTVSALTAEKDPETFVRMAAAVIAAEKGKAQGPTPHFVVMGNGPLKEELESLAQAMGLAGNITFMGHVPNVPELLPGLAVFVLCSREEGLGTSILDAMASGVPVVASQVGGIPEMVRHGFTGLLAEPGEPGSFAGSVLHLLANPAGKVQRLVQGGQGVVQRFSVQNMVSGTLAQYQALLNKE